MKARIGLPVALLLVAVGGAPSAALQEPFEERLARAYAPILYHDVNDHKLRGAADVPMRFDFDGNVVGDDNWDGFNQLMKGRTRGDRRAYLYYDVVETDTHYFIDYAVFHPQDWDDRKLKLLAELVGKSPEHENDLEPILVAVEKTRGDPLGRMVLLETQAHGPFHAYGDPRDLTNGAKKIEGPIVHSGRHPHVFIEAEGHGIYGHHETLRTGRFPGGDGFVFVAGTPEDPYDPALGKSKDAPTIAGRTVGYGLLSTYDRLWPLARGPFGDGCASDNPAKYRGARFKSDKTIGFSIQGKKKHKDSAGWPWGQDEKADGNVARGDWFFDPAHAVSTHFRFRAPFSRFYVWNPYLGDLGITQGP